MPIYYDVEYRNLPEQVDHNTCEIEKIKQGEVDKIISFVANIKLDDIKRGTYLVLNDYMSFAQLQYSVQQGDVWDIRDTPDDTNTVLITMHGYTIELGKTDVLVITGDGTRCINMYLSNTVSELIYSL